MVTNNLNRYGGGKYTAPESNSLELTSEGVLCSSDTQNNPVNGEDPVFGGEN